MTIPFGHKTEIPIVLTATIIPNGVAAASNNPEARLAEYIQALKFYLQFAPVFFLENSHYPLERHVEFHETARLQVRRFPPSADPKRGKGYQEFEMLDAWLATEPQPPAGWLKVTGRYQLQNIADILEECRREQGRKFIIDQAIRGGMARTYLFYIATDFYQEQVHGLYQKCDDRTGDWIERILFRKLKDAPAGQVRSFKTQPRILATAGTSGSAFPTGRIQWRLKQMLRNVNCMIDRKYLWYSQ